MVRLKRHPDKLFIELDFYGEDREQVDWEYNIILSGMTKESSEYQYWNQRYVTKKYTYLDKIGLHKLRAMYGFIDLIIGMLNTYNIKYIIEDNIFPNLGINIVDRWKDILNNPEFGANGYTQLQYLSQLLQYNIGIGKYVTGFGKTEMQLAIAESYLKQNPDKHALFILPSSLIIENFIERANKYNITCRDLENGETRSLENYFDINSNLTIVNPNGFMRSKVKNDSNYLNWLSNVGLLIMDEVHNAGSKSIQDFIFNYTNPTFIYGFSATPDKVSNKLPPLGSSVSEYSDQFLNVISLFSIPKSEVRGNVIEKDINLVTMRGDYNINELTYLINNNEYNHNEALRVCYSSRDFAKDVINILNNYKDKVFYLPVPSIELGNIIRENILKELNESLDSEIIMTLNRTEGITPKSVAKDLNELKNYINSDSNKCKLLITSQLAIESMDISNMSGVFMTYGKIPRITLQSLGRARAKNISVILIHANKNPILIKQCKDKLKIIKDEFKTNIKSYKIFENNMFKNIGV